MSGLVKWTEENIAEAARLWAKGTDKAVIAIAFDTTEEGISKMVRNNRALFPRRKTYRKLSHYWFERPRRVSPPANDDLKPSAPTIHADRVTRTIISGAKVTLPRVSFIDGPALEAAE